MMIVILTLTICSFGDKRFAQGLSEITTQTYLGMFSRKEIWMLDHSKAMWSRSNMVSVLMVGRVLGWKEWCFYIWVSTMWGRLACSQETLQGAPHDNTRSLFHCFDRGVVYVHVHWFTVKVTAGCECECMLLCAAVLIYIYIFMVIGVSNKQRPPKAQKPQKTKTRSKSKHLLVLEHRAWRTASIGPLNCPPVYINISLFPLPLPQKKVYTLAIGKSPATRGRNLSLSRALIDLGKWQNIKKQQKQKLPNNCMH